MGLTRCWMYGAHSRAVTAAGLRPGHRILLVAARKLVFKPKPGEEALAEATPWILHCADHFTPRSTVLLLEVEEEVRGGEEHLPPPGGAVPPLLTVEEGRNGGEVAAPTTTPPMVSTMVAPGGENRRKQRCLERACLRPGLATAATSTCRAATSRARAIAVTTAKCRMRVVLEEPKEFISDSPKVSGKLAFLSKRLLMQS